MANINELIASLQESTANLADGTELSQRQLITGIEKAHKLLLELQKSAKAAKDKEQEEYLARMATILHQLHQVAQEAKPEAARNLSTPQQVFQSLNQAYQKNLVPMLQTLQAGIQQGITVAHGISNTVELERIGSIAGVSIEVFNCCTAVKANWSVMNREEKQASTLGMVLMFTGIGLMIAATVNPATGPVVAGIVVVAVGCKLCRWAVARHKNAEADKVRASTDQIQKLIPNIQKSFDVKATAGKSVQFAPEPKVKATANDNVTLIDRLQAGFKGFFNPPGR